MQAPLHHQPRLLTSTKILKNTGMERIWTILRMYQTSYQAQSDLSGTTPTAQVLGKERRTLSRLMTQAFWWKTGLGSKLCILTLTPEKPHMIQPEQLITLLISSWLPTMRKDGLSFSLRFQSLYLRDLVNQTSRPHMMDQTSNSLTPGQLFKAQL